ncbi:Tad domain-containing protein [uncultured Marinobacter sp.]|uniref:Tad domain-containing protein n=1 Tax=uncultured Marinobacter sp. TaxID=187379 RepID=UPI0026018A3D|nr:Tad domain-containing protein [uncultured Marinobacter sp.]
MVSVMKGHKVQGGAILPLAAISLVAILGMAALALDISNAHLEKTRLQNALDAAALSAAKVLDQTGSTALADSAGHTTFAANLAAPGNAGLGAAANDGDLTLALEYSSTLNPFVAGTTPANYVRAKVANYDVAEWFAPVLGFDDLAIAGTAVAGPSPSVKKACDIAPLMACGTPQEESPPDTTFGYSRGQVEQLKIGSGDSSEVGNGNFYLIRLDGSQGGADVRDAAAGEYDACLSSDGDSDIETEPGNTVGPFAQGINTRLGIYHGPVNPTDHPPDWFANHETYTEADYLNQEMPAYDLDWYESQYETVSPDQPPAGAPGRRILTMPVGNCDGLANGQDSVELLGFACFYMVDEMDHQGQAVFYGQFKDDCGSNGVPGPNPGAGPGPHIIQLYKDPDTFDS